jgi:hypothetical protein
MVDEATGATKEISRGLHLKKEKRQHLSLKASLYYLTFWLLPRAASQ